MARISHQVLTALPSFEAPQPMTLQALVKKAGLAPDQVKNAVDRLSKRGLVLHERLARYRRSRAGDAFLEAGKEVKPGPRPGAAPAIRADRLAGGDALRDRAWGALRQLKKATVPELLELASAGDEKDPSGNLRRYLTRLESFGIVTPLTRRAAGIALTSNGFKQWVLVRDLGPKAPLWLGRKQKLLDRNTGDEVLP